MRAAAVVASGPRAACGLRSLPSDSPRLRAPRYGAAPARLPLTSSLAAGRNDPCRSRCPRASPPLALSALACALRSFCATLRSSAGHCVPVRADRAATAVGPLRPLGRPGGRRRTSGASRPGSCWPGRSPRVPFLFARPGHFESGDFRRVV